MAKGSMRKWAVNPQRTHFPVGAKLIELTERGAKIYSCDTCSAARGYVSLTATPNGNREQIAGNVMDGVQIGRISVLVEMLSRADKDLSFGGG